MKIKSLAVLWTVLTLLAAGCATVSDSPDAEEVHVTDRAELTALGLSCPLCASNLDDQVARIPGVASSRIDFETGTLFVQVEEGARVPRSRLIRAVRDAGFTPDTFRLVGEEE